MASESSSPGNLDNRGRARDRVMMWLKTRGPHTSAELAERLEVTPMAVRQHLGALEAEGLVTYQDEAGRVGRPARRWELTPAAASRFPDTHADLTVDLLAAVRETFGEQGMERLISKRSARQAALYRARVDAAGADAEDRIAALASLRHEEGYMAEWRREAPDEWLLVENHCPICAAATVCQNLCRDELAIFRSCLGEGFEVDRTDHILAGARRCAYRIRRRDAQGLG